MKAYRNHVGILMVASMLVAAANPAKAARPIEVSNLEIEPTAEGERFDLEGETPSGEAAPQILTAHRENEWVANIANAQPDELGAGFRAENPISANVAVEGNSRGENPQAIASNPEAQPTESPELETFPKKVEALKPAALQADKSAFFESEKGLQSEEALHEVTLPAQIAQGQPAPPNPTPQVPTFTNPGTAQPVPLQQPYVIPSQDPNVLVPNPGITVNGNPVAQGEPSEVLVPDTQFNLDGTLAPAASPLQPNAPAPSFLPQAVPPPVGDIAVSGVNTAPAIIDLGTGLQVDSLILKDAPVREVLSFLARSAGMNLVFAEGVGQADGEEGGQTLGTISLDLENESIQDAFNYVLQLSGLEANRRNRTIVVGAALPLGARDLIARSLRLNQVEAATAATFLATYGASVQILDTQETDIIDPETQRVVRTERQPPQIRTLTAQTGEGGSSGPLLLRGLSVSSDDRLNILSMVGEPRKIEMATSLLSQLDARVRQVALNVKVVDVNLLGQDAINSSFSFNIGDGFLSVDDGAIFYSYGPFNPPDLTTQTQPSLTSIPTIQNPFENANIFLDTQNAPFGDVTRGVIFPNDPPGSQNANPFAPRPGFSPASNPFQAGVTDFQPGTPTTVGPDGTITPGTPDQYTFELPALFQFPRRFLANLEASIQSLNAKILSDPTLVVQEGQEATVRLTQQVVGNILSETQSSDNLTTRTVTAQIVEAGLSLTINVDRIDDNGFITLSVAPRITSIGAQQNLSLGGGDDNIISLLNVREVSSGLLRLRDGQTLILAGIIQDEERTTVDKVPLLGDIPILGALFRRSQTDNTRREVIVLLTPQVLDDSDRFGGFGYNYSPGRATRDALQRSGVQVPGGR
ncbi:MAG: secretin and TonB N-terminal domain-containing protein [Cyanobacteriota bacterium]|nr:secretin and TonB N-terminal domain-containing protein [Cyanobacteriota bacterium]